ncbi:hypothetical protein BJ875DRAFT_64921 [Amylocarpus encephaloides]|uniref:FAD/NAD(P)-binding domain-containing protein n=1 Tax=Amylocarpus encephaloides TaxID=45428 RepID=A0A9P8C5B2_9HELO|nr:hypothetical protein BJ875DRAFT_64921 [Amylocarpus encephaloides]
MLDLNIWTLTTISKCSWDDATGKWTIDLARTRDGKMDIRTIFPKHVVQATGHNGEPYFTPDIKGIDSFPSARLMHSSKFKGALPSHSQNKKAIVVGSCISGHDIAKNFFDNVYSATMVQHSSTLVLTVESHATLLEAFFNEAILSTELADTIFLSSPNILLKRYMTVNTAIQNNLDKKLLDGLIKAGFKLDRGIDGSGFWMKHIQRGGGYYIDSGCSQLIVDGKIKVKQGQEISEILPQGIKFTDGEIIQADEIVFATGYLSMRAQCRKIFGDKVADHVKDVWGMDEEDEIRGLCRNSGHPGFWFMAGNLFLVDGTPKCSLCRSRRVRRAYTEP